MSEETEKKPLISIGNIKKSIVAGFNNAKNYITSEKTKDKISNFANSFKSDKTSIFNVQLRTLYETFTDPRKLTQNVQTLFIYLLLFFAVVFLGVFLKYYGNKDNIYGDGFFFYMVIVIVPIMLFLYYALFSQGSKNASQHFFILLGTILLMYILFEVSEKYESLESSLKKDLNIYLSIIAVAIGLVGLAIVFNLFGEKLKRLKGISGFIVNFIFFIPCIISDFFEYIKNQFYLTPSVNYVLLVVEILLILAYVYIPRLLQRKLLENGKSILSDTRFLDTKTIIATMDDIPTSNKQKYDSSGNIVDDENEPRKNYAISLWTYMNINAPTKNGKHVFSYGSANSFKPKIEYLGNESDSSDSNNSENKEKRFQDKYKVWLSKDVQVYVHLDPQRWNYWTFNYNQNVADIFINGKLVKSETLLNGDTSSSVPTYSSGDVITIGNEHLDGAICNITYHKNMMIESEIANNYNMLIHKNPPVNNLI